MIIKNISITKLQKSCPMYFCRFFFSNQQTYTIFCCIDSTFYRYARIYRTHDIEYSVCVFDIYNKNNLHLFSIFFNISIFSFLSLCVCKCVARKYSIFKRGPKGGGVCVRFYEEHKAHLRFTIMDSHFTVYEDNTKIYSYILIFT